MTNASETPGTTPAAPTQDERTWGLIAHLSALAGVFIPLGNVIAPLVIWLLKREQSAFIGDQAKEALNFNITALIAFAICLALIVVLIGIPLLVVLGIYWLVMTIVAAIKANEGSLYRYPVTLRLVT